MDDPIPFRRRLRLAAEAGLLLGVKLTLALAVALAVAWTGISDYLATRQKAVQGAAAFDYLQKAVAEQQKAQSQPQATPQAPPPAPGVK